MICNPYFKHMKKIFTKVIAILFAALTLSGCSIIIRTDDSPAFPSHSSVSGCIMMWKPPSPQ